MNKLEEINELRKKAGITFKKSFNCKDAEKNIHIVDSKTFFKKYKKRLFDMGYLTSDDLTFDLIRHKLPWAERHHVGRSYEWKYFYSTTFTIEPEMIDFLERHLFIFKKEEPKEEEKVKKSVEELIEETEDLKLKYKEKIKEFHDKINSTPETQVKVIENYKRGLNNIYLKMENLDQRILNLKQKNNLI